MKRLRIAVLFGGNSSEREVSLRSGQAVARALTERGHEVMRFDPAEQPYTVLKEAGIEVAFIALHGRGGEDGVAQAVLEWLGIPYTGSGVLASALAMNKWRTKLLWQAVGLPVLPAEVVSLAQWQKSPEAVMQRLGAALGATAEVFVKPIAEGSSVGAGAARLDDPAALAQRMGEALSYGDALVEPRVRGRELTVAFVGDDILPPVEIIAPGRNYDYHAKYLSDETQYLCPAPLRAEQRQRLEALTRRATQVLGCRGWGRLDVLWDEHGPWLLEMNTVPGMTDHSLVPMAARAHGWTFAELCERIVQLALAPRQKEEIAVEG